MSTSIESPDAGYWLATGPAEVEHLAAQAEIYAPEADELLDRIGLADGASAIDAGCGVLGILPQLRARVGPAGRVVGLDLEPRLLALAAELAARRGIEIEAVRADAAAWVYDPPHPAFDRLRDRLVAVYPRTGRDFHLGRRLGRLLRDAGLRDVRLRATCRLTHPGDYYHTFLLTLCVLLRAPLLAGGELTAARLDDDCAALREHLAGAHTVTCMPLLWQAWGSKP